MTEIFFITYYPKEDSTMPFNALEALIRTDAPSSVKESIEKLLEANGFDFMDESTEQEGKDGRWDYWGKILPDE